MPIPDEARGIHLETPSGFPWGWCVVIMLGLTAVLWKADAAHELPWLRGLGWGSVITIAGGVLLGIGVNGMSRAARRQEREKWQERNRVTVEQVERTIHDQECGCDRASGYCNYPFGAAARAVHRLYSGEAG